MITGQVTPYKEAVLHLELLDEAGRPIPVEAVVDTGFTGALTLPSAFIESLNLPYIETTSAVLADGTVIQASTYRADLLWDGQLRHVQAHEAEGGALIGMSLLYGFRLCMDIVDGGSVAITPLGNAGQSAL